ncbi:MAG: hypothetical protein ACXWLH_01975 [Candidatus Saccharimonadales bacterium]
MVDQPNLPPDERVLRKVALDNIRTHQIGGLDGAFSDGISEGTARDLGLHGFDAREVSDIRNKALEGVNDGWFDDETRAAGIAVSAALRATLEDINPNHPGSKKARANRASKNRGQ